MMAAKDLVSFSMDGLSSLQKMQQFLAPETFTKAQRGGVQYAGKAVPVVVTKGIGAAYNLKAARIKQAIGRTAISNDGASATIRFSRRPPTLAQFGVKPGTRGSQPGLGRGLGWGPAKPAGKPLTATVLRSAGRRPFPGAFLAAGNSGNSLVLRRASSGGFHSLYGPSVGSIFLGKSAVSAELKSAVQARINEQFIKGFQRVIDSAARGYGGR